MPDAPATAISPRDPRLGAWRSFLQAHARLTRLLDDELRAEHGLSLAEYDALLQLAQAPERRMRMNRLADSVVLSRSGVTRLIDRLVADGLVERHACAADARGAEAVLTPSGTDRLRSAARTHLRGVKAYFVDPLADGDLVTIERTLGCVARACVADDGRPGDPPDA